MAAEPRSLLEAAPSSRRVVVSLTRCDALVDRSWCWSPARSRSASCAPTTGRRTARAGDARRLVLDRRQVTAGTRRQRRRAGARPVDDRRRTDHHDHAPRSLGPDDDGPPPAHHRRHQPEVGGGVEARPRVRREHDVHAHGHRLRRRRTGGSLATIPDSVDLATFGIDGHPGTSQGAPVEAAFTKDGRFAYVSNYSMYGVGLRPRGRRLVHAGVGLRPELPVPDRHDDHHDRPGHRGRGRARSSSRSPPTRSTCSCPTGAAST